MLYYWISLKLGRLYDPVLGRMLSADNVVPDEYSTQGYNRYAYAFNNPVGYVDPDGQNPLLFLAMKGALINGAGYMLGTSGGEGGNRFSFGNLAQSMLIGGISAGLSFGIGEAATKFGMNGGIFQTGAHAVVQGALTGMQGGDFRNGFATGLFGTLAASGAASGWDALGSALLTGGGASLESGGSFWQGAARAGILAGFNHLMHGPGPEQKKWWGLHAGMSRFEKMLFEFGLFPGVGAVGGAASLGARGGLKLLNQFNSAESLIQGAGNLTKVKAGMQGFVKGDGAAIIKSITQGGTLSPKGYYTMPNGAVISKYFSSTTGDFTIFINQGSKAYKIRVTP